MHHSFSVQDAEKYGVEEAILIHHFQYWINFNYRTKRNFREGKYWTYQTIKEISAHFPYMTEKAVRRSIDSLVEKKVLIKGNFNKSSWDRTTWFSLSDDSFLSGSQQDIPDQTQYWNEVEEWESQKGKCICPKGQMEKPKRANGKAQKGTPIPDTLNTSLSYEEKKMKKEKGVEPPHPLPTQTREPAKAERCKNVHTTDEEHRNLVSEYGLERTERLYNRLSEWKTDTGRDKWKKNDYRSIKRWVIIADQQNQKSDKSCKTTNRFQNTSKDCKQNSSGTDRPELVLVPVTSLM